MIAQLKGILTSKSIEGIIVDVNGVGYEVQIPLTTFYQLPEVGAKVELLTYTYVAEGVFSLFGFTGLLEKGLFKKLLSVSGIGPRLALAILSGFPAAEVIHAITSGDVTKLTSISGVGKKTAERLIMELKEKISEWALKTGMNLREFPKGTIKEGTLYDEALSALMNLGYNRNIAEGALTKIKIQSESLLENVLKESLAVLAR